MESTERQELIVFLNRGREEFLLSFEGLTEEALRKRPRPDSWSVMDCAEHVAVVEAFFFGQIRTAPLSAEPALNPDREKRIRTQGSDRSRRVEAPETVRPADRFPSLEAALAHFTQTRQEAIQFVRAYPTDLRRISGAHPLFGPMNGVELLLFLGIHPIRHAAQVREIRSSLMAV